MERSPITSTGVSQRRKPAFIFKENQSYTFSQIFDLKFESDEILAELGYQYEIVPLALAQSPLPEQNTRIQYFVRVIERLRELASRFCRQSPAFVLSDYG